MVLPLLIALASAGVSPTEPLQGSCVDGWTGHALAGVVLSDLDGVELGRCDTRGHFVIEVPAHLPRLIAQPPSADHERTEVHLPRGSDGTLLHAHLRIPLLPVRLRGAPAQNAFGLPQPRQGPRSSSSEPLRPTTWGYALPAQIPATIRVLRCPSTSCCSAPGDGIETLAFEDYVKGVVNAEVGVFRNVSTVDGQPLSTADQQTGSAEVFKTLAVSSRSYALWWYLRRQTNNPGYDIRDGTCEQVYDSPRHTWVSAAVDATQGEILTSPGGTSIDKYEYASSCKRLGSIDFATSASAPTCGDVIPDLTGIVACAGSWCGHDSSNMGHQAHPCDSGRCRCLVRGICQWGAAERSYAGELYTVTLAHYQPSLTRLQLGGGASVSGTLVGFVREGDISNTTSGIAGAQIELSSGETATTNASGYYEISGLSPDQTVQVTARASGYLSASDSKYLDPAYSTWWKSLAMQVEQRDAGLADPGPLVADASANDRASASDRSPGDDSAATRSDASLATDRATQDSEHRQEQGGCTCQHDARADASILAPLLLGLALFRRRSALNG